MTTDAGAMRDRVIFDRPTQAENGQGGTVNGWQQQYSCWASIRWLRGGETVIAARLAGRQPAVVRIRACAAARAIAPDWRMRLDGGAEFAIRSIILTADRAFYDLTVEGGVAA